MANRLAAAAIPAVPLCTFFSATIARTANVALTSAPPRQMKPAILLILAFLSASISAPLAWQVHARPNYGLSRNERQNVVNWRHSCITGGWRIDRGSTAGCHIWNLTLVWDGSRYRTRTY